jgi:hypothetical protein
MRSSVNGQCEPTRQILQLSSDEPCPRFSREANLQNWSVFQGRARLNDQISINSDFELLLCKKITVGVEARMWKSDFNKRASTEDILPYCSQNIVTILSDEIKSSRTGNLRYNSQPKTKLLLASKNYATLRWGCEFTPVTLVEGIYPYQTDLGADIRLG